MAGACHKKHFSAGRFGRGFLLIWLATAAPLFFLPPKAWAQDDELLLAQGLAAFDGGDFAGAFDAWDRLAAQGHADAQTLLAGLYMTGRGVPKASSAAAADYYRKAARQGQAVAQLNLGDLYSRGLGVTRDLAKAYLWLSRAADQGRLWAAFRRAQIAAGMTETERAEAQRLLSVDIGD